MDHLQEDMVRLADGDRRAFDSVYGLLWPMVHRFCAHALAGSLEAEDVAQVSLTKVFLQASNFNAEHDARAWALSIAAYECRTFRQRQHRRREQPLEAVSRAAEGTSPEDAAISRDLELAANELLRELRPADAETLRAVMRGQRPPVKAATFRKRMQRALERLRTLWRTRHGWD